MKDLKKTKIGNNGTSNENKVPQESKKNRRIEFLPENDIEGIKSFLMDLVSNGAHFGNPTLDPTFKKSDYVCFKLNGCNIINLEKTIEKLRLALQLVYSTVCDGYKILFTTTNDTVKSLFKKTAEESNQCYIIERYRPGTLTNYSYFKKHKERVDYITSLALKVPTSDDKQLEKESKNIVNKNNEQKSFYHLTKKERKILLRDNEKANKYFCGVGDFDLPKLMIIVGGTKEHVTIIKEVMALKSIFVIVLGDSNTPSYNSHNIVTIPCNTKSTSTIELLLLEFKKAILKGYEYYIENNKSPVVKNIDRKILQKTQQQTNEEMVSKIISNIENKNKNNEENNETNQK